MQQSKPNDTPKIIGLSIAIVITVGFLVWRVMSAMKPKAESGTTASAPSTQLSPNGEPIQVASNNILPGQMRMLDGALDMDPQLGQVKAIPTLSGAAFKRIEAPRTPIITINPDRSKYASPPRGGGLFDFNSDRNRPLGNPSPNVTSPTAPQPIIKPSKLPSFTVTLDGVILGDEGFAMLTLREKGVAESSATEETFYRRIGERLDDRLGDYVVHRLASGNVVLRGYNGTWNVGETLSIENGKIIKPLRRDTQTRSTATFNP